jgi:hypothetical protein
MIFIYTYLHIEHVAPLLGRSLLHICLPHYIYIYPIIKESIDLG